MAGVLSTQAVVARSSGLLESRVDDEIVALNIETGTCYGLNAVGSRIWTMLEGPIRISDICTTLVTEYEVSPETCERDVLDLIEALRAEEMIVVTDVK